MKSKLLLLAVLFGAISANAQMKNKKSCLFIDSTARKHELQLNVGTFVGNFLTPNGKSIGIDLTYARVYKGTHFLRAGIGFNYYNTNRGNDVENIGDLNLPDTINYQFSGGKSNTMAWAKVGYEISIGKRKTRFLFGSDLMVGYFFDSYYRQVTTGKNTPSSNASVVYANQHDYQGILVGLNPRASVRYNFSKLFSGGVTMGLFMASSFALQEREWNGANYVSGFTSNSSVKFDLLFKPELNLIFKIP